MAIAGGERQIVSNEKFVAERHGVKYVLKASKTKDKRKNGSEIFNFSMIAPADFKAKGTGSLAGGDDGKTFTSLSGAASAITLPGMKDGWMFWTREKEWTPEMAYSARGATMKDKPRPERKAKAEKPVSIKTTKSAKATTSAKTKKTSTGSAKTVKAAKPARAVAVASKSAGKASRPKETTATSNGSSSASPNVRGRGKSEPIEELDI